MPSPHPQLPASGISPSQIRPVEIGSLSTSSLNESQFFGSSSGVFFVNTVFRAFAESTPGSPSLDTQSDGQAPADYIAEQNDDTNNYTPKAPIPSHGKTYDIGIAERCLGWPPTLEVARRLVMLYFELWHPVFPFLHGPTFLQELETFYAKQRDHTSETSQLRDNTRQAVLFQCVFSIAAMDTEDNVPLITSASSLMSLLGMLSAKHDTPCLQALLAAQLYLITTMSLQAASTVGGMLWRNIFHAGFHRCPYRYAQLSHHDCEIRKRMFWCSYATDRYLSQALGHPLGIQDSDIDVCVPGTRELHKPVPRPMHSKSRQDPQKEILLHLPDGHPDLVPHSQAHETESPSRISVSSPASGFRSTYKPQQGFSPSVEPPQHAGEDVLACYIEYSRITGQVVELLHKSIHTRSVDTSKMLIISAEVQAWWNGLPHKFQDVSSDMHDNPAYSFAPFFTVLHQQLIMLVNRSFLSLDPTNPVFNSSLQTCIGASRIIISTLKNHRRSRQCLSAPAMLSATWMAGLVIAFSCQLNAYPFHKGFTEIETCLVLLQTMGRRWNSAKRCHKVLSILLPNLNARSEKEAVATQAPKRASQMQSHSTKNMPRPDTASGQPGGDKRPRFIQDYSTNESGSGIDYQEDQFWQDQPQMQPDMDFPLSGSIMASGINELQGPDVFEQVSWEALFHGEGTNTAGMASIWH